MHFQVDRGAAKLVRCGRGAIFDAIVDVRRGSPTFGQWEGFELTDENARMLYVPVGFAHGFCVLSDVADVFYKQDRYYADATERGIKYDDPAVGVEWPLPVAELKPSQRDADAPTLAEIEPDLPFVYRGLSGDAGARHVVLERVAPGAQRGQAERVGARAREHAVERAVDAAGRDRRLHRLDRDVEPGELHDRHGELEPRAGVGGGEVQDAGRRRARARRRSRRRGRR